MDKIMDRITTNRYIISYANNTHNILLFALFFLIMAFEICQLYSACFLSLFYFIVYFSFMCLFSLITIIRKKLLVDIKYYIFFYCLELITIVLMIKGFSSVINPSFALHCYMVILCNLILLLIQSIQIIYFFSLKRSKHKTFNKNYFCFILLSILISFLLSIECLNAWPRWDTYSYFNEINNMSISNIFYGGSDGLIVCGHISMAYSLLSLMMKALSGLDMLNAMYIFNAVLMFVSILLFFYILNILLPSRNYLFYSLAALLCGCSPYLLGTIHVVNPEKLLLVGILLFIYGTLKKNVFVCLIAAFITCNTKETGVPVIAVMTAVTFIKSIFCYCRKKKAINIPYYLCIFVIGISWLVHHNMIDWSELVKHDIQKTYPLLDGAPFNGFSFSWLNIIDTLKGEFLTNFSWLFLIVCCAAFLKYMMRLRCKKGFRNILSKSIKQLWNYWEIIAGFIAFELVMCLFVTYHFYRYYTPFIAFLYIMGIVSLDYFIRGNKREEIISYVCLSCMLILLFIQSYYTIDPVMLNVFDTFDTGNGKMAALDVHMQNYNDPGFQDTVNYNRQTLYFDKAIDKCFASIEPDDDTVILVSDEFWAKEGLGSLYTIWGYGFQYTNPVRWGKFNSEKGSRYLDESTEHIVQLEYVAKDTDIKMVYPDRNKRIFYIEMPWYDLTLDNFKERYKDNILLYDTIKYRDYVLNVYQIDNEE